MNRGELKIRETSLIALSIFVIVALFSFIGMSAFFKEEKTVSASSEEQQSEPIMVEETSIKETNEDEKLSEKNNSEEKTGQTPAKTSGSSQEKVAYCSEGFSIFGSKCKKEERIAALEKETCPEGFSLQGEKCVSGDNIAADIVCLEGFSYSESEKYCFASQPKETEQSQEAQEEAEVTPFELRCEDGYLLDDESCRKQASILISYFCPDGFQLDEGVCKKDILTDIQYR